MTRDDRGAGEHGAQDAGASAEVGGVGFGGSLAFLGEACHFFGVAEFLLAAFFFLLQLLVFGEPGSCQVVAGGLLGKAVAGIRVGRPVFRRRQAGCR